MARKNQWEQFANNFSTFYDLGNKVQGGIASRKIMDEEIETIRAADAGTSPHASGEGIGSGTRYKYDGKMYKEQITADQLTGLRNKRLSDNMVRFGDSKGAMEFNLSNAKLRESNNAANLAEGQLKGLIDRVKIENDAKIASMDLDKTQMARIKRLQPYEVKIFLADIAAKKQALEEKTALQAGKVTLQTGEIDLQADKVSESEILLNEFKGDVATGNREQSGLITKAEQANEIQRLKRDKDIITSTYTNEVATALLNSGQAKNEAEAAKMASDINLQGSKTLTEFATKMGKKEFKTEEDQKKWLIDAWDDTHDPRIKEMIAGIDAMELSQITIDGTRVMTQVNAALSSGTQNAQKKALVEIMDAEDGIAGNMQFETDKTTGIVRLVEYPSAEEMKAGTNGQAVINEFGTKKGWNGFTEGLEAEFTPLKSLEISKANAEIRKLNAEAGYKEKEAGQKKDLAAQKAWTDHTDTDLFRQIMLMVPAELEKQTGFKNIDEYKQDWLSRAGVTAANFDGFSSPDFP